MEKNIYNATVESHGNKGLLFPHSFHHYVHSEVLLSTANVLIQEPSGNYTECRAVLDSGSQASFISRPCAERLNLDLGLTCLHVESVAALNVGPNDHFSRINLRSIHDPAFNCEATAYVVPRVARELPITSFLDFTDLWPHLHLLRLADPEYYRSREIDLLLGADCFPFILCNEVRIGTEGQPMAQATVFGWVLLGPMRLEVVEFPHPPEHEGEEEDKEGRDAEGSSSSISPSFSRLPL